MLDGLTLQNNGIPIYVQLRDQIAAAIGRGALAPGARLPTMREVAVALAHRSQHRAARLCRARAEGILAMVQGRGTFVAEAPPPRSRAAETEILAAKVAAQAQAPGVSLDDSSTALRELAGRAP